MRVLQTLALPLGYPAGKDGRNGTGAGDRTRTGDPNLGKVVLYQLSYSREDEDESCPSDPSCQAPLDTGKRERGRLRKRSLL